MIRTITVIVLSVFFLEFYGTRDPCWVKNLVTRTNLRKQPYAFPKWHRFEPIFADICQDDFLLEIKAKSETDHIGSKSR